MSKKAKGDLWKVTTTQDTFYVVATSAAKAWAAVPVEKMFNEKVTAVELIANRDQVLVKS